VNDNVVDPNGPIAMIGAGTGLGHGYIIKNTGTRYYHVYPSEGGHQDFAPQTDLECRYLKYVKEFYKVEHVSVERACSGPAIPTMYSFFKGSEGIEGLSLNTLTSEEIIKQGLKGTCQICVKVLELFTSIYAAAAGNVCLLLIPTGGLYLLGGLSVALEEYIINSNVFRVNFAF
jgi:glucokinase